MGGCFGNGLQNGYANTAVNRKGVILPAQFSRGKSENAQRHHGLRRAQNPGPKWNNLLQIFVFHDIA
jgi:hypothetical protein